MNETIVGLIIGGAVISMFLFWIFRPLKKEYCPCGNLGQLMGEHGFYIGICETCDEAMELKGGEMLFRLIDEGKITKEKYIKMRTNLFKKYKKKEEDFNKKLIAELEKDTR